MTPSPILSHLDEVISKLQKGEYNTVEVATAIRKGIEFLNNVIQDQREEINEQVEVINALSDQVKVHETDIEIILQFLKDNGIDMSYVVRYTEQKNNEESKESDKEQEN